MCHMSCHSLCAYIYIQVSNSLSWGTVFPIAQYDITPAQMLQFIGITEVVSAVLLFTPLAALANFALSNIMAGAIYYHYKADGGFDDPEFKIYVTIVLFVLLWLQRAFSAVARASAVKKNE